MLSSSEVKIHIAGIGGAGMSSIALVLMQMGHKVSGSDLGETPILKNLAQLGMEIFTSQNSGNIKGADCLAVSTAISEDNEEVKAAKASGIPVLSRAEILAQICSLKKTLAVAGSHGKTTTTAMLADALKSQGVSWVFGGQFQSGELGGNWDSKGEWLIVEADESDKTFLQIPRQMAVITSTDSDHLETYGSAQKHRESYLEFAKGTEGPVICNTDDEALLEMSREMGQIISFGTLGEPDILIQDIQSSINGASANLQIEGKQIEMEVPLPGAHNILNGAAAVAAARELGTPEKKFLKALKGFPGVARRFETKGFAGGVTFIDDYAHLPLEIQETLKAASSWGRVVCAFQPHRYSRTEMLWKSYADAFESCEVLAVSEIYPAGEIKREGITGKLIVNAVLDAHPRKQIAWIPNQEDLKPYFRDVLRQGDVFLTLNAGNLSILGEELLQEFSKKPARKSGKVKNAI